MNIYEKLAAIQQKISVPKGQQVDFGAKFKYRSAEDILEKLKPLLEAEKAMVILSDEVQVHAEQRYVMATAHFIDIEKTDVTIKATALAREGSGGGMSEPQLTGSASSYARKYALNGLLLLDDNKDPDSQDNRQKAPMKPVPPKTVNDPLAVAKNNLQKALKAHGIDNDTKMKVAINKVLQKNTVDTVAEADEVLQAIEDGIL